MELPSKEPQVARDMLDVHVLVAYLKNSSRTRPVVVLTLAQSEQKPYVDAGEFFCKTSEATDIVTLPTDSMTYALADKVGRRSAVFGGGCRVYPPGTAWLESPFSVPLRLMSKAGNAQNFFDQLLADASKAIEPKEAEGAVLTLPPAQLMSNESDAQAQKTEIPPSPDNLIEPTETSFAQDYKANTLIQINRRNEMLDLINFLKSADRTIPVVLISRATGYSQAIPDALKIAEELMGVAQVFELTHPTFAWDLSNAVPVHGRAYGGSTRVYPAGVEWIDDASLTKFFTAFSLADRGSATAQIVSEALRQSYIGSHNKDSNHVTEERVETVPITGVVQGVVANRVFVKLNRNACGASMATIVPELVTDGVDAAHLVKVNQQITGELNPESMRIDVSSMLVSADELLSHFQLGSTYPAIITNVQVRKCIARLAPGLDVAIGATDIMNVFNLRDEMSVGDVVAVKITEKGDTLRLSVRDAADLSLALESASILRGGPPWLDIPTPVDYADEQELPDQAEDGEQLDIDEMLVNLIDSYRQQTSGSDSIEQLDLAEAVKENPVVMLEIMGGLLHEVVQAQNDARRYKNRSDGYESQLKENKAARRDLKIQCKKLEKQLKDAENGNLVGLDNLFVDKAQQLDFEVDLSWARRISAQEKLAFPLKEHIYSEDFFVTWEQIQGVERAKVVDVIVEVLTGIAANNTSRELHRLRTGGGGDDPVRKNNNGETYWRVSIQVNTPQARRLHYLQRHDGSILFTSIRVHDDFRT
ncbi:MAG: hypothetical protein LBS98_07655 [Coriobacteriales bacterium]|nr:hypothetical protein [Coriobacteriales bacterium]